MPHRFGALCWRGHKLLLGSLMPDRSKYKVRRSVVRGSPGRSGVGSGAYNPTSEKFTFTKPAPGGYEDGEFGGMMIGKGNQSTQIKTWPRTTLSTRNPTWSERARNRAAAVGSQRLTAWVIWPLSIYLIAGKSWMLLYNSLNKAVTLEDH
jgi:hypothetical protein